MWAAHSGPPLFDHLRSVFSSFTTLYYNIQDWFERPLVPRRIANSIEFFHSILQHHKRKTMTFPSPGFEPTTFLIHDLIQKHDKLDRSTTAADLLVKSIIYLKKSLHYFTIQHSGFGSLTKRGVNSK